MGETSVNKKPARSLVAGTQALIKRCVAALFTALAICCIAQGVVGRSEEAEKKYNDETAKNYDFRFGANPFAPSNAKTASGGFIPGEDFVSSARCAKCHTDSHAQWSQSAHRNSFREPFYQKNVKDLIEQRGIESTRHCEACHNPAALFSGALTKNSAVKRPFDEEGVSCIACHSIQATENRGIGAYVMGQPALLIREDGARLLDVTDQQILDDVPSHRRAMMRPVMKSPEFCASCHKSQVPKELNDYKFLRAFAVYDEFQMSSFSKQSPHPFYERNQESCQSCHMKRDAAPLFDVSAKDGMITSHRWAAANTAIPYFYNWTEQLQAVTKNLEADVLGVDIFALHRQNARGKTAEDFIAPVNRSNFKIDANDRITADVVITNKNIGHSFAPELRDFYEPYVEFTVSDEAGKIFYNSGFIKPNGYLDESAHTYKTYLVKTDGSFNDLHHIWNTRVIAQNNQIHSGRSDLARYQFRVPANARGALRLTARVRYRRFTRIFSDYALGHKVDYPIVTMVTTEYVMSVGDNTALAAVSGAKGVFPDWRRWNNYGIALFDAKQYPLAADAFAHVADLDETYRPMARVNRAMTLIELDRYDEAEDLLANVIEGNPKNMRAVYQQARVFLKRGQLDKAEENIRQVLTAYPRDRISWQQLGELYKIKRDFPNARHAYEQILAIDPEDTAAHYNLMLLYRRLGLKDEAKREAKIFADQKDDPAAFPTANGFLRQHPEMSNESVPWHVHELSVQP